jgi:hypothetical protein
VYVVAVWLDHADDLRVVTATIAWNTTTWLERERAVRPRSVWDVLERSLWGFEGHDAAVVGEPAQDAEGAELCRRWVTELGYGSVEPDTAERDNAPRTQSRCESCPFSRDFGSVVL